MILEIRNGQGELLFEASQQDVDSWDVATYDRSEQTSFGMTDTDGVISAVQKFIVNQSPQVPKVP